MGWSARIVAVLTVAVLLHTSPVQAQLQDRLSAYTGRNAHGYFSPLVDGLAADLTAGHFHSAYIPRKSLSISLELRGMSVYFSDADRTFVATTEGSFQPETSTVAPTVIGSTRPIFIQGNDGLQYAFPAGFNIQSFSTAVPQLRIGSIFGTEAVFRYAYLDRGTALLGDMRFDLYGAGLRHSISQYLDSLPIDMAASVFYQHFRVGENGASFDVIAANTLTLGVQASKRFDILQSYGIGIEPYTGIAWDRYSFTAQYESDPGDRAEIDFGWQDVVQLTLGMSLRMAFLNISGEYNILDAGFDVRQSAFSLGLAVQYRNVKTP